MIRVSVLYPKIAGKRFDVAYYKNNHMPLVKKRLRPITVEIDIGIPNEQGQDAPYIAIAHMTFASREQLAAVFAPAAQELRADIPHYTDIEPITQLSEVISI
jgi:uncharacterized protein (TIGR02118 family)